MINNYKFISVFFVFMPYFLMKMIKTGKFKKNYEELGELRTKN
jgi:hypothetical protein